MKHHPSTAVRRAAALLAAVALFSLAALPALAAPAPVGDQDIYTDSFQNGWQYWGWAKTVHPDSPQPVHGGTTAIAAVAAQWEAVSFHHPAFDAKPYAALAFWINPGAAGETFQVKALRADKPQDVAFTVPPGTAGQWQRVIVPLSKLGADGQADVTGFFVQSTGAGDAAFTLDDVALLVAAPAPVVASGPTVVTVDAALDRHPISPLIYGANFVKPEHAPLNAPLNRIGGNDETRYNWKDNSWNIGQDYFYESVSRGDAVPGKYVDDLIAGARQAGAESMVTIPTIGWVGKVGPQRERRASFSVAKYGPQKEVDKDFPDAGKGVKTDGTKITGNDPNDANVPADPDFMRGWVEHLVSKWGRASQGGVKYYLMDNEPSLWQENHRDVHPAGPTMQEVFDRTVAYATMVKSVDPTALVVGPEAWDWNGSRLSGADIQHGGTTGDWDLAHMPDRTAHGGEDFFPWFLDQLRAYDKAHGGHLVDIASLHYYPQGELNDDVSPATQLRRNRSTRSLWDPSYKAESWVNDYIDMLPRFKNWVKDHYPGLKTALTEYNWGADAFIGGATAQADVLGILGREGGIDIATRFSAPNPGTPVFNTFRMFRNYDGKMSTFGETSVRATAPNPDDLAAFASLRARDHALTVLVINKTLSGTTPLRLRLAHLSPRGPAQVWQLTSANVIARLPDAPIKAGALAQDLPSQSLTLYVIPTRP